MNVSHEGAAFLVRHSPCHAVGADFKELRPRAATRQGDALEVGCVFSRRSQQGRTAVPLTVYGQKEAA